MNLKWLKTSLLPKGVVVGAKDGLYAEVYEDGQLAQFGYREKGEPVHWHLILEKGKEAGEARKRNPLGGSNDGEIYSEGTYDTYNAWSDYSKPVKKEYRAWVEGWIEKIMRWHDAQKDAHDQAQKTKKEIARKGKRKVIKPA